MWFMLGKTLLKNTIKKVGLSHREFIFEQSGPVVFLIGIIFFIVF